MRAEILLPVLLLVAFGGLAEARPMHYGAVQDPGLGECDALAWRGRREDAAGCYRALQRSTPDPAIQAEAAWALGDPREANYWFQEAVRQRPDDAIVRVRWGDLYTDTYQNEEALKLYREALDLDPENTYAGVGAARVLSENFLTESWQYLRPVLENEHSHGHTVPDAEHSRDHTHAGARLQAILLQAWMALESDDRAETLRTLDAATVVATDAGLPQLEIYALRAALDLLDGAGDSPWISRALTENPAFGEIYATPAHFFWINHRYRESVGLYEKALALAPENRKAQVELGINLLRDNRVTEARRHLEDAYAADPFNPKTVNTLRLLDTLDDFVLLNVPEQPEPGREFPQLSLRMHKQESAILGAYVRELAGRGIELFSKSYRFQPRETIVVEIYPNHEDFVVRTVGMPGLGILGATFGYLFAMDSPTAHSDSEYHWGTTLWHELAHVFTLEASRHTVPRWFSEGVSVFEEWRDGPVPGIRIPVDVFHAIADDKLLPVAELNQGFIRPSYEGQVQVSYIQAGLVCEFISRELGFEKLVDLLYAFDYRVDTAQAIETTLGIDTAEFDRRFQAFLDREYGGFIFKLDLWSKAREMAGSALEGSDWEGAVEYAEKAIAIHPDYVEADSPYLILARAHAGRDDQQAQVEVLRTFWRKGGYAPEALRELAIRLHAQNAVEEAIQVLRSLNHVRPFDEELHALLGDWLLQQDRAREALVEFEVLLALEPHDRAMANYQLARTWHVLGEAEKARKYLLETLDIAPHYRPAQKLLLELTQPETRMTN
ncbi:MAG: hypothetical protein A3I78_11285 [Gammaproteobacteria bacterium RIFCSPLOWO2_02_FULL_56_15]|nr:MAG: hypothetical protein A3I78_11285 [Gammaproteobacteria bacterium RIFCSPLOWO2_02_FULL_56_15]